MSKKKRRILDDHQQQGKRFIPPLLRLGKFESVRWQLPILPELLWLALLNESHGLQTGAEVALSLALAAEKAAHGEWFAPTSAYSILSDEQRRHVLEEVSRNGKIEAVRRPLASLIWFYPECPLKFLFPDGVRHLEAGALSKLKSILGELYYRAEHPAMLMQANAVYIAFVTNLLKVPPHVSLANFPEIAKYPETAESKRVGSMVRATITGMFGQKYNNSSVWPSYFWNRGLELERCDFQAIDKAGAL